MYYYLITVRTQALLSAYKTNNYLEDNNEFPSVCSLVFIISHLKCSTTKNKKKHITISLGKNKTQMENGRSINLLCEVAK